MSDHTRDMQLQKDADMCGVNATTYAAALECIRKEQELAAAFSIALLKFYPGYPWEVKVEAERAAVMFRLPIMPPNVYMIVPFRYVLNGPTDLERMAKFTGGEILEKFNLSRAGINFTEFEEARPRPMPLLHGLGGTPFTKEPPPSSNNDNKPKLILPN